MSRSIGLLGDYSGDWRAAARRTVETAGLEVYDPSDARWGAINHDNGDRMQDLIDTLVAEQHAAIASLACAVFYLSAWQDAAHTQPAPGYAARCELGFLTGHGIPSFVHVAPDVVGRNYLWAQMKPHPHMQACADLDTAVQRAVHFVLRRN